MFAERVAWANLPKFEVMPNDLRLSAAACGTTAVGIAGVLLDAGCPDESRLSGGACCLSGCVRGGACPEVITLSGARDMLITGIPSGI